MITVTETFLDALRAPHGMVATATAYPPSADPVELPLLDGSVTIDRTADQRRELEMSLAPFYPNDHALAGQSVYPLKASDPLNVYGTEVIVKRGLRFANNAIELVQLGVFRVESVERSLPGGNVTVTGWDRSRQVVNQRFLKPRKFDRMKILDLIQLMISEVYPSAVYEILGGDNTYSPRHVVERDRWAEVVRVAQLLGCEVFATELGTWRIQDVPDPVSASPVWDVDVGPNGVLVSADNSVTRDGVPNAVIAIGDGTPTVFVSDGFGRSQGSGWGTAGSGDDWNVTTGSAGDFDVAGSSGRIQAAQGDTKRISTNVTDSADVDATATIQFPNAITGGDLQASLGLRGSSDGLDCIRVNVTYDQSTGHIITEPQKSLNGSVTSLGSTKNLGDYTADNEIHVRLRLNNNDVKAKAWFTSEPKRWDWDTSQSDLQNAGRVQCRLNRGSGNTNSGTPQVTFDDVQATATGTWYGIAHDDDPTSPTYWEGAYGHVPVFYASQFIRTQAQADRIAAHQLRDHLGATRLVSFGTIVNPALDAGDAINIKYSDGTVEKHIIDVLTIPLDEQTAMTGETRVVDWNVE